MKRLRGCEEIKWTNYRAGFLPEFKASPQVHSKIKLFTKDATQKSGKKTSENVQFISLQPLKAEGGRLKKRVKVFLFLFLLIIFNSSLITVLTGCGKKAPPKPPQATNNQK